MPAKTPRPNAAVTLERRNRPLAEIASTGKAGIDTASLHEQLLREGTISLRTVQRDLELLAADGAIASDHNHAQPRWRLAKGARLPAARAQAKPLDSHELKSARVALSIVTLYEQASHLLHRAALDDLREQYLRSREVLDKFQRHEGRWLGKVVSGSQQLQLRQAPIDETVLRDIQLALLEGYQLEALYHSRRSATEQRMTLNPLGLSYRDSSIYLICTKVDEVKVRALPLQRFRSVTPKRSRSIQSPPGFDLQTHARQETLLAAEPIQLKLRINAALRERLDSTETPLAEPQHLSPLGDGWWLLECEMAHTRELQWWILAHGATVEVLEPPALRQAIAQCAREMAGFYAAP